MRRNPTVPRSCLALLIVAGVLGSSGCATLGFGPTALRRDADAALQARNPEEAFAHLKELATEYPDSREAKEAFPVAAELSKLLYYRHRVQDRNSPYATTELDFMYGWLARYFEGGTFPEVEANTLFGGFPGDVFQRFQSYAETDPRFAGWKFRATDDNGVIYSVSGERAGTASSR